MDLSVDELANRLEISRQTLWRWESGVGKPSIADLEIIAKITGKEMMFFIHQNPEENIDVDHILDGRKIRLEEIFKKHPDLRKALADDEFIKIIDSLSKNREIVKKIMRDLCC